MVVKLVHGFAQELDVFGCEIPRGFHLGELHGMLERHLQLIGFIRLVALENLVDMDSLDFLAVRDAGHAAGLAVDEHFLKRIDLAKDREKGGTCLLPV